MKFKQIKQDNGTAGLTILLSLVVMLFIIGLIIMIFTLMGSELQTATFDQDVPQSAVTLESVSSLTNVTGDNLAKSTFRDARCSIYDVVNASLVTQHVPTTNYTTTNNGCTILLVGNGDIWYGMNAKVNYTWTYDADNTATLVINDTTGSLSGTTDWFDIFIVIGAMVVLILLTVIIITAIRSSGMVSSGSTQGASKVGTA